MLRWTVRLVAALVLVVAALALILRLVYGGGAEFPDRTTAPALDAQALEVVAELPTPPGNIAVSATGRIFLTLHPEARPDIHLVEWVDGAMQPYPDAAFQHPAADAPGLRSPLGIRIDRQNRLWVLDNGHHGADTPALYAFDLDTGARVHTHVFSADIAPLGSHLNDLQVAPDGDTVYIADASFFRLDPAVVVYDVNRQTARRVVTGHASVTAERYVPVVQGRRMQAFGLVAIRPGVDSIALSRDGDWLYFAPITNNYLYRASTRVLTNASLTDEQVRDAVQRVALKTMSDGISIDNAGNVYLTDLEHSAIVELDAAGELTTLLKTERLRWPDGLSFGPDGWLYITASSLHDIIGRPPSAVAANAPYQVLRIQTGAEAPAGH